MGDLYPGSGWLADYGYLSGVGVSATPPRFAAFVSYVAPTLFISFVGLTTLRSYVGAAQSFRSYVGQVAMRSYTAVTSFISWER